MSAQSKTNFISALWRLKTTDTKMTQNVSTGTVTTDLGNVSIIHHSVRVGPSTYHNALLIPSVCVVQ